MLTFGLIIIFSLQNCGLWTWGVTEGCGFDNVNEGVPILLHVSVFAMAVDDRAVFSDSAAKQPSSTDVIDDNVDLGSFMTHYTQVIDQLRLLRSLLVQLDKIRR